MTLPFRRRHHDDEGAHDRARALTSREMLEPLPAEEAGWLAGHLEDCAECRQDRAAYLADRELLRSMRDRTPEPPRDLWARTSAALDREARARPSRGIGSRTASRSARQPAWRGLPFGAMAGALIVLVVLGASLIPPIGPVRETPGGSGGVTTVPEPTPFEITAGRIGWIRAAGNGSWELVFADVDAVCPRTRPSCRPLAEDDPGRPVDLGSLPTGVTISPSYNQLVVEAHGAGATPDRIFVMPVPPATPAVTPAPTEAASPGTATAVPSTAEPATPEPATPEPATPAPGSPEPSVTPDGVVEIASGVTVVGEAAYSDDGAWLAFSARPSDGSTGPDLYLWSVGAPSAVAVTSDHQTYFSAWLGGRVLASRVVVPAAPAEIRAAPATPVATAAARGAGKPLDGVPTSFLLDPVTLASTDMSMPDVWLPVVDPTDRFVTFWSGTLRSTTNGLDWELGKGELVLDRWSAGPVDAASPDPGASVDPSAAPAGPLGPAGTPVVVANGAIAAFKAKFDPSGTRLAIWVGEQSDAAVGRLQLIVLNSTGAIDPDIAPLRGAPALRRFSIDVGRLAWVSPSGQDGQESAVQVLGWSGFDFGEIRTIPSKDLYIVH